MQGQIIKQISNQYTVITDNGVFVCKTIGKFRYDKITPIVGDYCIIDKKDNLITKILPRKNELKRPIIANVDRAIIITSLKEPSISTLLLDKMISLVTYSGIKPVIIFTKKDLLNNKELRELRPLINYYKKIGIPVFFNNEKNKIKRYLKNKTVVLVGQSGAGKSTLLNKLDKALDIETKPISKSLGRGVHTTRHTELYKLGKVLIADTPGFSSLAFDDIKKEDIDKTFIEFREKDCRFTNCMHLKEAGCEVLKQLEKGKIMFSRYDSYVKILKESSEGK